MTRIDRRRFVQLSAASGAAVATGGLSRNFGIQPRACFRPRNDATLGQRLRLCAVIRSDHADQDQRAGAEGSRDQDQSRNRRRVDNPGARHLFRVVRHRPRHYRHNQQLAAALRRKRRRCQRHLRGDRQGAARLLRNSKSVAYDGKKWLAVPNTIIGLQIANRSSWWDEVGYGPEKYPASWEEWRDAGKKLKAKGRPLGQTLAHALVTPTRSGIRICGRGAARRSKPTARPSSSNGPATLESVKFAVGLWKDACDEGGLAWDDSATTAPFLPARSAPPITAPRSISKLKRKPNSYRTADGKPLKEDIFHTALPKGPAGQFSWHVPFADMVMAYGKNQKAAKDFLRWVHDPKIYEQWWVTQQGFSVGPTRMWADHKLWQDDPIMLPFRTAAESGRFAGYAGPAGRKAAEVISKYIISDMYAKAVQGMAPEDAVKWAHAELVKIYA